MILHWSGAQIYSPALHLFFSEDPGETSHTEWVLTSQTSPPCPVSRHSLGFHHPQLLNYLGSKLSLHGTNNEGHCKDIFINTTRASLGLVQSWSDTRTCSFQYPCLKTASESITGLAASKLSFLSPPLLLWNGNEIPEKFSMKEGIEENEAICKQRWIRKHFFSWHLPKPLILALYSSSVTQGSCMEEKVLLSVQKNIIPAHPCLLLVPILV